MQATHLALLALLAVVGLTSDVIDITAETFDSTVQTSPFLLLEIYAPWCGHCKKLAPEWEKAATELKGVATLAKVDATVEKQVASQLQIRGYPTIFVFRNGVREGEYEGPRTSADIVTFAKLASGPAVIDTSSSEVRLLIEKHEVICVVYSSDADSTLVATFRTVANELRQKLKFALVKDPAAGKEGFVVLYKQFDELEEIFTGDVHVAEPLLHFLRASSIKLFDEIGPKNYKLYLDRKLPMVWLFVSPSNSSTDANKAQVAAAATFFKGTASFVWVDADQYGSMAKRVGLSGANFPSFAIDHDKHHYILSEGLDLITSVVSSFVQSYLDGKLKRTIMSEATPEAHTKEGLTTIVGNTFDELALKCDKDLFLVFHAPWCGHCKKLIPELEALGKKIQSVSSLRLAIFDATSNDYDNNLFAVSHYPTLYFVPSATKKPQVYDGERSGSGIMEFLKQNARPFLLEETSEEL